MAPVEIDHKLDKLAQRDNCPWSMVNPTQTTCAGCGYRCTDSGFHNFLSGKNKDSVRRAVNGASTRRQTVSRWSQKSALLSTEEFFERVTDDTVSMAKAVQMLHTNSTKLRMAIKMGYVKTKKAPAGLNGGKKSASEKVFICVKSLQAYAKKTGRLK